MSTSSEVYAGQRDTPLASWRVEEGRHREGWDFSSLSGRVSEEDPPWDFEGACRAALRGAERVLDMGTGGAYADTLLQLHTATPVTFTKRRFWLRAVKPAV